MSTIFYLFVDSYFDLWQSALVNVISHNQSGPVNTGCNSPLVYSDVVRLGLVLPKKRKYTQRHIAEAILQSLFKPFNGRTLTPTEAKFIVKCSAIYHGVEYGKLTVSETLLGL